MNKREMIMSSSGGSGGGSCSAPMIPPSGSFTGGGMSMQQPGSFSGPGGFVGGMPMQQQQQQQMQMPMQMPMQQQMQMPMQQQFNNSMGPGSFSNQPQQQWQQPQQQQPMSQMPMQQPGGFNSNMGGGPSPTMPPGNYGGGSQQQGGFSQPVTQMPMQQQQQPGGFSNNMGGGPCPTMPPGGNYGGGVQSKDLPMQQQGSYPQQQQQQQWQQQQQQQPQQQMPMQQQGGFSNMGPGSFSGGGGGMGNQDYPAQQQFNQQQQQQWSQPQQQQQQQQLPYAPQTAPFPGGDCQGQPYRSASVVPAGAATAPAQLSVGGDPVQNARKHLPCSMATVNAQLGLRSDYEVVLKYAYNAPRRQWVQCASVVKIDDAPFESKTRNVYNMLVLTEPDWSNKFVAKEAKTPVKPETLFDEVEALCLCHSVADEFNQKDVPKKVNFLDSFVIERVQRPGRPLLVCERLIEGVYKKYSQNIGFMSPDERNTPQAFSHFSYVHSEGNCVIADIQSVGDWYTEPKIHTSNGEGFGSGNLGREGISIFLQSHQCNPICQKTLQLPPLPK